MPEIERYNAVARALHWWIAVLILAAFGLGLTVDDFPHEWEDAVVNLHVLIGLTVLVLSLVRLGWRLSHRVPELPPEIGALTRRLAAAAHALLYVLMVAVPAIGVPTLLFRGRGIDFGLFQTASPFARTPEIARPLTEIHELGAYALIGLAAAHMLAALYHHFVQRDAVLLRMLGTSRR